MIEPTKRCEWCFKTKKWPEFNNKYVGGCEANVSRENSTICWFEVTITTIVIVTATRTTNRNDNYNNLY